MVPFRKFLNGLNTRAGRLRPAAGLLGRVVPAPRGEPAVDPLSPGLDPAATPACFGRVPHFAHSPLPRLDRRGRVVPGTGVRKFVDALPGTGPDGRNELGAYLPVAVPDTISYPGCDYYEIGVQEYAQRLHRDLPATRLRGYRQLNLGTDPDGHNTVPPPDRPYHPGPLIMARRGRPVRIKFINQLPTGAAGDLFLPVDPTVPGAGPGPLPGPAPYAQNRAVLHLHGGATGWISAGNPLQWVAPAAETAPYPLGPGVVHVPDMPTPGPGAVTLCYPNGQSGRLLWCHDNTLGLARLTVYSGQVGLYLLEDEAERRLVADGVLPGGQIPLVIEDKTFVPEDAQLAAEDPTWDRDRWGATGSLWYPHVYLPRQNPYRESGINPVGRWDYGPWCRPSYPAPRHGPVPNPHHDPVSAPAEPPLAPAVPHPSAVPAFFGDTPLVNGVAYPYLVVEPKAYRFRILNACLDRSLNLQLYRARADGPMWHPDGSLRDADAGEVPMVEAVPDPARPAGWPTDGRPGGVPDPQARGPELIQIGSDGGLLPAPVVLPNQPINYEYDRRDATVLNARGYGLLLSPGERADVVIDFSRVPPGANLVLYNDAPAPLPAFDPRYDHHTGDPDRTATGGAPTTVAGYGPNTRTLLQFRVAGTPAAPFDLAALAERLPEAYAVSQARPIVPQPAYDPAFGTSTVRATYVPVQATDVTFTPADAAAPVTLPLAHKVVAPAFDPGYGRAGTLLGVAAPRNGPLAASDLPLAPAAPPTEILAAAGPDAPSGGRGDGTQLWRITNRGRQTEHLHFPFDVQVVNRVGWDGSIRPPDRNELGWKQVVRVNPREDLIVALRPAAPVLPFKIGDSVRLLDPTRPAGVTGGFTDVDPADGRPVEIRNRMHNFGWEYRWSAQVTGDGASRPVVLRVGPQAPTGLTATPAPGSATVLPAVTLTWTGRGSRPPATGHLVQRATDAAFSRDVTEVTVAATATGHTDSTAVPGVRYHYRVRAENAVSYSAWSNRASAVVELLAPVGLTAVVPSNAPLRIGLRWTNRSFATGVEVQRATNPTFTSGPSTTTLGVTDSRLDPAVRPDTTYYYRVRTTYLGAASAWSMVATVTTPPVPAVPTEVTATVNRRGPDAVTVSLTWQAEPAGAGGGFVVQRAGDARFSRDVTVFTVGGRGFTNAGLTPGRAYYYRVRAVNVVGSSAFTAPVVVRTPG